MIELRMATPRSGAAGDVMTASFLTQHDSDDEWDVEVRDSENLDRTLSDIIEGKSPLTTPSRPIPPFSSLDGAGDIAEEESGGGEEPEQCTDNATQGDNPNQTPSTADASVIENRDRNGGTTSSRVAEPGCDSSQGTEQTSSNSNTERDSHMESTPRGDSDDVTGGRQVDSSLSAPTPAGEAKISSDCDENFNEQTVSDSQSSHVFKSSNGDCASGLREDDTDVISSGESGGGVENGDYDSSSTLDASQEDIIFKESTV